MQVRVLPGVPLLKMKLLKDPCENCLVKAKCHPHFRSCELTRKYKRDQLKATDLTFKIFNYILTISCYGVAMYNLLAVIYDFKPLFIF